MEVSDFDSKNFNSISDISKALINEFGTDKPRNCKWCTNNGTSLLAELRGAVYYGYPGYTPNRELKCNSTHCPILLKRKMYTDILNKPNSRAASLGKALRKLKIMGNTSYWCPPWIFIINSSTGRVMWANTNTYEISKQSYEHISASLAFVACTEGNGSKKTSLHSVRVENRDLLDGIQVDKVRKVTNSEAIFDVLDEKTNKKFTLLVNDLGNMILTAYASYISTNITDKHLYLDIDLQGSIKTLKLSWNYDILRVPTGVFAIKLR